MFSFTRYTAKHLPCQCNRIVLCFGCVAHYSLWALIWQRRRAVPSERIQGKEKVDFDGVKSSQDRLSNYEQALDPNTYMELKARSSNHEQSHVPTEYQSLQEILKNPEYYSMVLHKENGEKQNEEVYEEIWQFSNNFLKNWHDYNWFLIKAVHQPTYGSKALRASSACNNF